MPIILIKFNRVNMMIHDLDIPPTRRSLRDEGSGASHWNKAASRRGLAHNPEIRALMENAPLPTCILSERCETLLANDPAKKLRATGATSQSCPRPGDFFGCIYAHRMGGCGHTAHCAYCGLRQVVAQCQEKDGERIEGECDILTEHGGKLELKLWAHPFRSRGNQYIALTLEDQSHEKQRVIMERIFFHDVLNTASGLQWASNLLEDSMTEQDRHMIQSTLAELSERLIDEITAQRDFVLAKSGDYHVNPEKVSLLEYVRQGTRVYRRQLEERNCKLDVHVTPPDLIIETDANLLKRVLINLLKNATEAAIPGETIHLSAVQGQDGKVTFTVKNTAVMPDRVRLQIFRHQTSTKGQRRGYGLESARLLTGQYLEGQLSFVSQKGVGTIFTVELPPSLALRHAA